MSGKVEGIPTSLIMMMMMAPVISSNTWLG